MQQASLIDLAERPPTVLGPGIDPHDRERLGRQYVSVRELMKDSRWRTLREIAAATNAPEASVSARLRDMRRDGFTVERERVGEQRGLYRYRAVRS